MKKILAIIALLFLLAGTIYAATDQILSTDEMVGSGHATKDDTLNRALNKLTTAGDMPYATAAQTLTRLGIGTANFKLFSNAGATAPEWARGVIFKTFTRDMTANSGDVSYTGAGFLPSLIFVFTSLDGGKGAAWGAADASTQGGVRDDYVTTAGNWAIMGTAQVVNILSAAGAYQAAVRKTLDADGCTLTWTKTGSPTGTAGGYIIYLR